MTQLTKKVLIILLLADLAFSFYQHFHKPLDGDMSEIIVPRPDKGYYQVLHDPFGLGVLLHNQVYANPNRFFAHWTSSTYFLNMPLLLQIFTDPINSVYLSVAMAKTAIQILILFLLAVFISNKKKIYQLGFLIAAALISPLFQTEDFSRYLGVIDQSVIYTFFYAFPLGLLMLFYLPFYDAIYHAKKLHFNVIQHLLMIIFIFVLTLNGPLVPGVVLIACPMTLLIMWISYYNQSGSGTVIGKSLIAIKRIDGYLLFYFTGISLLSLYSLYIGQNNALNASASISLLSRYERLPAGIYYLITQKLGYPLMLLAIAFNVFVIRKRYRQSSGTKLLVFFKWFAIFSFLYIVLLPLGGYRSYRENILRYDTIMPITLGLMYFYGATSFYLLKHISGKNKKYYLSGIIVLSLIFTAADIPKTGDYQCERQALESIAKSPDNIVALSNNCPVMEWHPISDYHDSALNADLFYYWHITDERKLYYYRPEDQ
ncbi:MAG: hypothetical protein WC341_00825 [Bacteroidales bacterium]|jgi:uncharacterized integral membrane protein